MTGLTEEEHHVVPEAREAVHRGHLDDEREEIVDEGVDEAVAEEPPRELRHALQPVVDDELRAHEGKPEAIHRGRQGAQDPRIPVDVALQDQAPQRHARHQRHHQESQRAPRLAVDLLGKLRPIHSLFVRPLVPLGGLLSLCLEAEEPDLREATRRVEGEPRGALHLPRLDRHAHGGGPQHEQARALVLEEHQDDELEQHLHGHGARGQALERLVVLPEVHVASERQELEEQVQHAGDHGHREHQHGRVRH
mmetsp:Transcript_44748/g.140315  ORF Transcript_44748/g.140315 Transcript_44748/m.140315 type:complete len:251 (-) Transcript_44748:1141-1893(-)